MKRMKRISFESFHEHEAAMSRDRRSGCLQAGKGGSVRSLEITAGIECLTTTSFVSDMTVSR